MSSVRSFFVGLISLSICISASAQVKTIDVNGNAICGEHETPAIVLERARIQSELEAVDQACGFVMQFAENLSEEKARAVAGRILQIQSSRVLIDGNRYFAPFVATIDSDNINSALEKIDESVKNQIMFRQKFNELESDLKNIPKRSDDARSMQQKVRKNEKELADIRNFVAISAVESAGSGTKKNLFGYVENLTEKNGNLFFELKDPTSDATIRCTLIARLNSQRPEFRQTLESGSPVYLFGMLARFQGKVSMMVWNVYL